MLGGREGGPRREGVHLAPPCTQARRGYSLNRSADLDAVRQLKERLCYVALDYKREVQVRRQLLLLRCGHPLATPTPAPRFAAGTRDDVHQRELHLA